MALVGHGAFRYGKVWFGGHGLVRRGGSRRVVAVGVWYGFARSVLARRSRSVVLGLVMVRSVKARRSWSDKLRYVGSGKGVARRSWYGTAGFGRLRFGMAWSGGRVSVR